MSTVPSPAEFRWRIEWMAGLRSAPPAPPLRRPTVGKTFRQEVDRAIAEKAHTVAARARHEVSRQGLPEVEWNHVVTWGGKVVGRYPDHPTRWIETEKVGW